jgi:hypothetical protein
MKRHVFPVLILALILPVLALTGCPQDSGDSTPSGNLGDGNLVLKGTVYTVTPDALDGYAYTEYTTADTVEVRVQGSTGSESLGTTALTNGEFEISISGKPSDAILTGVDGLAESSFFNGWNTPTAVPASAKGAMLSLRLQAGGTIQKWEASASGSETSGSMTEEFVLYLYVDQDITITLGEKEESGTYQGISGSSMYRGATLKLDKGWNALYFESESTISATKATSTDSVSVGNPDLKWVKNN